jgi:hypothetical protein
MSSTNLIPLNTQMVSQRFSNNSGYTPLNKAADSQARSALALISAIQNVQNLPSHLGQNINTTA